MARETIIRSSAEYGWLYVKRETFERMLKHGHAGYEIDSETAWVLAMDETGATCLWKGVQVESEGR